MITLINNCVLFPHRANWAFPPSSKRVWETEVTEALPGAETRQALRSVPRRQCTFTLTATTLQIRSRLDARLDAASKSGLACAPLYGRASSLAANAAGGANSINISAETAWTWQAGDWAILIADDLTVDALQVTSVTNAGLTLNFAPAVLVNAWGKGELIWPLLFGKFAAEKESVLTGWHAHQKITITELTSGRAAQIGVTPAARAGVGAQVIGSTNVIG